jgi:hypothetical protein
MNLEKAVKHGDTLVPAKNQKPVFAFASRRVRRVAVVKNRSLINSPWEINLWRNGYMPRSTASLPDWEPVLSSEARLDMSGAR